MVKNSREKAGPGPIRALSLPEPVDVQEDESHGPVALVLNGRKLKVTSIEDVWEIVDEWWRTAPIARRYYRLVVEGGPRVTVFRDLLNGLWYRQAEAGLALHPWRCRVAVWPGQVCSAPVLVDGSKQ